MNEEIWYGANPKLQLFRASESTKYTGFIDIDTGIKELIIKTHLSITIRLLRQLSKTISLCNIFWDTLYIIYTIVNCSLLVFGVVVIVKRHNGRLGLVDDRVLGGEVENQQELIQNQN